MTTTTTQASMTPTQPTVEQARAGIAAQVRTSAIRRHIRALQRVFSLVRGLSESGISENVPSHDSRALCRSTLGGGPSPSRLAPTPWRL